MNHPASHSLRLLPEGPRLAEAAATLTPRSVRADLLKILIVDSDPCTTGQLEQLCRALLGNRLARLATADSVESAAANVAATGFDVVLLDPAAWPNDQWLRFRALGELPTIVVSARLELAVAAFEWGALDFVPKPVVRARLARALQRVERRPDLAPPPDQFLAVRRFGRIDLVAVADLLYVEGADKYSELVLANGRRDFYDQCLGRLEATLPESFVRIHKSYLVRFSHVSRLLVLRGSRYFAELHSGQRLPVGRSRYARLKSRLLWTPAPRG